MDFCDSLDQVKDSLVGKWFMHAVKSPVASKNNAKLKRRIWSYPEVASHSLVVLTNDSLVLAPLAGVPSTATLSALAAGVDLDELLGPLVTSVAISSICRVRIDLLANSLTLEYRTGLAALTRLSLVFATTQASDVFFTKIWRRLGNDFKPIQRRQNTWSAARAPLTGLAFVLVLMITLALMVGSIGGTARAVTPEGGSGSGWMIWGMGGVAAAAMQVWFFRRMTRPPDSIELMVT